MIRHFVAIKHGVVVGSRSTETPYPWAVLFEGAHGPFATFHRNRAQAARFARQHYAHYGAGQVVPTMETPRRWPVNGVVSEWQVH